MGEHKWREIRSIAQCDAQSTSLKASTGQELDCAFLSKESWPLGLGPMQSWVCGFRMKVGFRAQDLGRSWI